MNSIRQRIEQHSIPEPNSGCWLWTRSLTGLGYARLMFEGKSRHAHRLAYEEYVGPIPPGLEIDHKCRVRCCVNPEHLEPVTHLENVQRGLKRALYIPQTHCKRGHEFTVENTRLQNGRRLCKQCIRAKALRYRWENIDRYRKRDRERARLKRAKQKG